MRKSIILILLITTIICLTSPSHAITIAEIEGNDSFATAQNINPYFSINTNPDVFGSLPTVSIEGSNGAANDVDYYSFMVGSAGIGYFDIDDVTMTGPYVNLETTLSLFDAAHNLLAADIDTINYPEDPASISTFDSFLGVYNFINPGTYYIAVSNQSNYPLFLNKKRENKKFF